MGTHMRHLAPIRRREKKTVHEDSRWKPVSGDVVCADGKTQPKEGRRLEIG